MSLSSNQEDEFFCDGIMEEIINSLAGLDDVYVTSRTSSFFFKNKSLSVSEIAKKLGVRFVVQGSVRRSGKKIRIAVQLINAEEDFHYWSENFDYQTENIFHIQDEVANSVEEKFREHVGHFEIEDRVGRTSLPSVEGYELILQAKRLATELSESGVSTGLGLIEKAIELDPKNPSFLAHKATYISVLGIMGAWPAKVSGQLAMKACREALKIDPEHAESHAIMGHLIFALEGDLDKFYFHINKCLSQRPRDVNALYFLSIIESAQGNYDKSLNAIEMAFELDPMSLLPNYFRAANLMRLRKFDDALETVNTFLINYPRHLNAYNIKGLILLRMGKHKLAIAHFCKMPLPNGKFGPFYGGMAKAYALIGNISEAENCLKKAIIHDDKLNLSYYENPTVFVNFFLGRFDAGFSELKKDIQKGKWYVRFYKTIPFFDAIMADPRSEMLNSALLEKTGQAELKQEKYTKSGLSSKEIKSIEIELLREIENGKPYLDPDLSLKKLAQTLRTSPNHLSQVINMQQNKNFFDFINSYRIKELMELLKSQKNEKFTLLSLAFEAGFNSKSTFNSSFKKLTGLTPTEYLKSRELRN